MGFAIIALENPKTPANVGGVLRAAHCFSVAQVNIRGDRIVTAVEAIRHSTNTAASEKHLPVYRVEDVLDYVPFGTEVVAVEKIADAMPLPAFKHPKRAIYVFGPEDGTLGRRITDRAQHVVSIPMRNCLNLATCACVVLYDRLLKGGEFGAAMEGMSPATRAAIYGRHLKGIAAE